MKTDILVVDDESEVRDAIAGILEDEGYKPRLAANSDEAFLAVQRRVPGLVLLDIWLEGSRKDGMALLEDLKAIDPTLPILMISGHGTIETAVTAIKKGAYDFLEKPFQADRLLVLINRAIEAARLKRENIELAKRAGGPFELIGRSPAMQQVRTLIARAAPTNSRLLLTGPPGSGKEVVARQVHARSRRSEGPFIVVSAATMTGDRMETELFGAEAGYPTPDRPRQLGLFEQAHGGTILLDEVADMPQEAQAKILRVLQEQSFIRPGGQNRVDVDVRVLAASNRDLQAEMTAGRFRSDLFYRLNVVPIPVPSLAERRLDIPLLAEHFMERAASVAGLPSRKVSDDTMTLLQAADWPGNVRQLRNVIEWMLIMAPGEVRDPIGVDGLPPEFAQQTTADLNPNANGELMTLGLREARVHFERRYLQAQLDRFGGNISRTASFVGMERSALHRKLKSLNIHSDD
ncbi:nitrogen assimilation response regulator NtrX [Marinivivus vitaminiproducens]|uniref:nitrogen assimilation response regulator NtrX n=1 Tax=Marinivivus vitaminiproducens TaxID=3035935 RepID=UPI00279E03A4|nr:sigma-54 dependent transcriptional regulator [Geminicoccaceae bacterium SCSIO 64248]